MEKRKIDYAAVVSWMKYENGEDAGWQVVFVNVDNPLQRFVVVADTDDDQLFSLNDIKYNFRNTPFFPHHQFEEKRKPDKRWGAIVKKCDLDNILNVIVDEICPKLIHGDESVIGCSSKDVDFLTDVFGNVEEIKESLNSEGMKKALELAVQISIET